MFSTSFLIGVQKRVLPRVSHYFLLGPMQGGILALFGGYLVGVWKIFWEENQPKTNTKTIKNFLLIFYKGPQNEFYLGILITSY